MGKAVIFTSIDVDDLCSMVATRLVPVLQKTILDNTSDEQITLSQAADLLGKTTATVRNCISDGRLKNYGTGNQRPKLSRKEVFQLKKNSI